MGKVIVVTSGKGGVGKTTTTANVGGALTRLGRKVLLVDMDVGLRNLDLVMGLENRVVYTFMDVLEGRATAEQAMVREKRSDGALMLLAASQLHNKQDLDIDRVRETIAALAEASTTCSSTARRASSGALRQAAPRPGGRSSS